jgi:hypothetical protein
VPSGTLVLNVKNSLSFGSPVGDVVPLGLERVGAVVDAVAVLERRAAHAVVAADLVRPAAPACVSGVSGLPLSPTPACELGGSTTTPSLFGALIVAGAHDQERLALARAVQQVVRRVGVHVVVELVRPEALGDLPRRVVGGRERRSSVICTELLPACRCRCPSPCGRWSCRPCRRGRGVVADDVVHRLGAWQFGGTNTVQSFLQKSPGRRRRRCRRRTARRPRSRRCRTPAGSACSRPGSRRR